MNKKLPASLIGSLLILVAFFVLVFLPSRLERRNFNYDFGSAEGKRSYTFPLDREFPFIYPPGPGKPGKGPKTVTLRRLLADAPRGLIVNFWATWCPPCLDELPSLELLQRQLGRQKDKSLPKLITLSVDENADDVTNLFKTLDFTPSLPVLYDKSGVFAREMGSVRFPETYWIDAEGKVLYKWVGPQNWLADEVVQRLHELAAGN